MRIIQKYDIRIGGVAPLLNIATGFRPTNPLSLPRLVSLLPSRNNVAPTAGRNLQSVLAALKSTMMAVLASSPAGHDSNHASLPLTWSMR